MAVNPPFDPINTILAITDTANTMSTFSSFLTSVDGLPGSKDLLDTSKIGDSGHTFTPSLHNGTFVIEGLYDNSTSEGFSVSSKLVGILSMTTASAFVYAPTGLSTTVTPRPELFSGSCFMRSFTNTGRVNTAITFRAEFQVEGIVDLRETTGGLTS